MKLLSSAGTTQLIPGLNEAQSGSLYLGRRNSVRGKVIGKKSFFSPFFGGPYLYHMEVPRLEVELEL